MQNSRCLEEEVNKVTDCDGDPEERFLDVVAKWMRRFVRHRAKRGWQRYYIEGPSFAEKLSESDDNCGAKRSRVVKACPHCFY